MISCVCIEYDYDGPEFVSVADRKARKVHTCGECGEPIPRGQRYEVATGKWDGDFSTHKTCTVCRAIREDFMSCGFAYGRLWEDLRDVLLCDGAPEDEPEFDWLSPGGAQ